MKMESMVKSEFMAKMMEAKKIEKDAFLSLLPGSVHTHVDVIEKELKAIIFELVLHMQEKGQKKKEEQPASGRVKKVQIDGGEEA